MNKLTFYEQVGIVIPGSVFLVGLLFYFPALHSLVTKDGVTLGQFGIFLLLSYAAGHFLAAVGNVAEGPAWELVGGMPSEWVTHTRTSLLSATQIEALAAKASTRLNVKIEKISGIDRKMWFPISREIYADVAKNGKPDRIDTFNANYGLSRGLAIATFGIALTSFTQGQFIAGTTFFVIGGVYVFRTYRFARYYARELYVQFLILDSIQERDATQK